MRKKGKEIIDPPEGLGDEGQKWWNRVIPQVTENYTAELTPADLVNLENLACLHEMIKEAEQHLREESAVIEYINGNVGLSKWEVVYNKKLKLYYELAKEYGLTPMSGAKLKHSQNADKETDGLDTQEKALFNMVRKI